MIKHITLNFVVDRVGRMVSVIATERKPSENERSWSDWTQTVVLEADVYHCLGRGDHLSNGTVMAYCASHRIMSGSWSKIDLVPLGGK